MNLAVQWIAWSECLDKKSLVEMFNYATFPFWALGYSLTRGKAYKSQVFHARVGLADIFTAGLGFLFAGIFAIVVLAVFGGFATIGAIWPASNVTKITTNIANAVVAGAAFLSILILLIEVGFLFVVIGLVAAVVTSSTP